MNTIQKLEVYELFKKTFSIDDAQKIMPFFEDVKYNHGSISARRKLEIYEIFKKAFSPSEADLFVSYILAPKCEEMPHIH